MIWCIYQVGAESISIMRTEPYLSKLKSNLSFRLWFELKLLFWIIVEALI